MADPFAIRPDAEAALLAEIRADHARTLSAAVPAAVVAGVWQALLDAGAIEEPDEVDLAHVRVRAINRHLVALSVPLHAGFEASRAVRVAALPQHSVKDALAFAAERLRETLNGALNDAVRDYLEPGQKPYG
jgi:hypothetical protein